MPWWVQNGNWEESQSEGIWHFDLPKYNIRQNDGSQQILAQLQADSTESGAQVFPAKLQSDHWSVQSDGGGLCHWG